MVEKPKEPSVEIEQQAKPNAIEPLKLKAVNGFRARIMRLLRELGIVAGLGIAAGSYGGVKVQNSYREMTGYHPDQTEVLNPKETNVLRGELGEGETIPENPKRFLSRLKERASHFYKKAKRFGREKMGKPFSKTKIGIAYREGRTTMKNYYEGIKRFGDKAAFWGPFLTLFLATVLLAKKTLEIKKKLTEVVDPAVEQQLKSIEAKLNEVISVVNNGGQVNEEEIYLLTESFEKVATGDADLSMGADQQN